MKNFVENLLEMDILSIKIPNINVYIEIWLDSDKAVNLPEYLGLSHDEYKDYMIFNRPILKIIYDRI